MSSRAPGRSAMLVVLLALCASPRILGANEDVHGGVVEGITRYGGVPTAMRVEIRPLPVAPAAAPLAREPERRARDVDWLSPGIVEGAPVHTSHSDAGGAYRIPALARGHYEVRAVAPDGQRACVPLTVRGLGGLHLVDLGVAPGTQRLAGRARQSDGRPFKGWLVLTQPADGRTAAPWLDGADAVPTDAEGGFDVRGLLPSAVEVWAVVPGRPRSLCRRFETPPEGPVELVVEDGSPFVPHAPATARVSGVVRDVGDDTLVFGAWVHLTPIDHRRVGYVGVTDAKGRFAFEGVLPDAYGLYVSGGGWIDADPDSVSLARRLGPGASTEAELRALRGEGLKVRVVDGEGTPCPGVEVWGVQSYVRGWYANLRLFETPAPAVTDADGRCEITSLVPEKDVTVHVAHPRLVPLAGEAARDALPGKELRVLVRRLPDLTGRVDLPPGVLPRRVRLTARAPDAASERRPGRAVLLRPDASFRLATKAPGKRRVRATAWRGDTFHAGEVTVEPGAPEPTLHVSPAEPRNAWLLRVLDPRGGRLPRGWAALAGGAGIFPIFDGEVAFEGGRSRERVNVTLYAFTDADGQALSYQYRRLGPLRPGVHTVRLEAGHTLRVRVVDTDGQPVPDASVGAWPVDRDAGAGGEGTTDATGSALLVGLGAPPLRLHVRAPRFFVVPTPVEVSAEVGDTTVVVTPFVKARLVVTRQDGSPVAGAVVRAGSAAQGKTAFLGTGALRLRTGPDGSCRLPPLAPGVRIDLSVEAPGPDLLPLERASWAPREETLSLAPAHVLRGRVRDAEGEPVVDATVWVRARPPSAPVPQRGNRWWRDPEGFVLGAVTKADGSFAVERLEPGELDVRVALTQDDGTVLASDVVAVATHAAGVVLEVRQDR